MAKKTKLEDINFLFNGSHQFECVSCPECNHFQARLLDVRPVLNITEDDVCSFEMLFRCSRKKGAEPCEPFIIKMISRTDDTFFYLPDY